MTNRNNESSNGYITPDSNRPAHVTGTYSATFTLQVSNPHGIVCFTDLAAEMQKYFDEEMNAKNRAYSYILSKGLLHDFMLWSRESNYDDPHEACVNQLSLLVTEQN